MAWKPKQTCAPEPCSHFSQDEQKALSTEEEQLALAESRNNCFASELLPHTQTLPLHTPCPLALLHWGTQGHPLGSDALAQPDPVL